jgi:uncharacterized protein with FMN-binding domain
MRRVILTILGTAAGLVALLSFKSHSGATTVAPAAAGAGAGGGSVATAPAIPGAGVGSSAGSGSSASSGTAASSAAGKTVTGSAASTIYGPVQVQITVKDGKVTAAQAVEYPEGTSMDQQVDAYAIPTLNQETVAADSAKIDMVSGATYTSQGYLSSLQSALDQAGLK